MRGIRLLAAGGCAALAMLVAPAFAQQYPNKPITIIVPFAAGGPTDVVARLVGEHMGRTLRTDAHRREHRRRRRHARHDPRRPGAGRRLHHRGRQHGHAVGGARALSQPQIRSGEELRADRHRQLHAAGDRLQEGAATTNLKDFIDYVKANGSKLSYGHAGVGSISHVAGLVFNAQVRPHAQSHSLSRHRPGDAGHGRRARSTTWSINRSTSSRRSRPAPSRSMRSRRPSGCRACRICRPPRKPASISSSAPGTRWSRPRTRRRKSSTSSPTR